MHISNYGTQNMKYKIAPKIKHVHSRIAETYAGGVLGELKPNSYDAWSKVNILKNIGYILTTYCKKDDIFLDAGCGNGQFTEILIKNFDVKKVVGADFSKKMLEVAKRRAQEKGYADRIELSETNLEAIGFEDETFDVVYFFGVIEHLDDPQKVIEELVRVCKVNGICIIVIPRKWSLSHVTFMIFGQNPRDWGTTKRSFNIWSKMKYYRFYSFGEVKKMIDNTNRCKLLERIPSSYIWAVGLASLPFRALVRMGKIKMLDKLDRLFGHIYRIPAGEFLIVKKIES